MSRDAREFAEAASMAMQQQQAPEIKTLLGLSVAYSLIEIAESLTRFVNRGAHERRV